MTLRCSLGDLLTSANLAADDVTVERLVAVADRTLAAEGSAQHHADGVT